MATVSASAPLAPVDVESSPVSSTSTAEASPDASKKSWLDAIASRALLWVVLGSSALALLAFLRTRPQEQSLLQTRTLLEDPKKATRGVPKIVEEKLALFKARDVNNFNPIVGGDVTTVSTTPWQVMLVDYDETYWPGEIGYNYFQFCGASIISDTWIATAAHCVEDPFYWQWLRIAAGQTYAYGSTFDGLAESDFIRVSEVYVRYDYISAKTSSDIALLKLASPLTLDGTNVAAINVPGIVGSSWPIAGTDAVISGWGTTSAGGSQSNQLKSATIDVLTNPSSKVCGLYTKNEYINTVMLCGGVAAGGVDTCQGDSGGPLAIYNATSSKWILGGITSWGTGCADKNYPGVYTRVTAFVQWIQSIVSNTNVRLSVIVSGNGIVTSSPAGVSCTKECNTKIAPNKAVLLTAKAITGRFVGWTGGVCSGTKNKCTVKINQASTVTAIFA